MRFDVTHTTHYEYSREVYLEPHTIRLRPRCDSFQHLMDFGLEIEPAPAVLTETLDAEGNSAALTWFEGTTKSLMVRSRFAVETLRPNPFDYLLLDAAAALPLKYPPEVDQFLARYRVPASRKRSEVTRFAEELARKVNRQPLPFLTELNRQLFESCEITVREVGDPVSAEQTLASRQGACRDVAVLFIECCKHMGIAARFVSGYQRGEAAGQRYMHAWAEVFLPGGGWRGYDPSHGLAVANDHVAVAASSSAPMAAPIVGTFRGAGVESKIRPEVKINVS